MAAGVGTASLVDRVCAAAVALLDVDGAGVSLMVDGALRGTAGRSEPRVEAVQELQLTLGEGPCIDAFHGGGAVLEPDLNRPEHVRWPAFARAGERAGVGAVFALPLQLGAIRIGVLVVYRARPGPLTAEQLATGLLLADIATQSILGLQAGAPSDEVHELLAASPPHWAEIHQATGMAAVQLDVSLDEAFVRLRAHAFATDRPLRQVAADVVARRLRLQVDA